MDPTKCSNQMNLEEKLRLVYEVSEQSEHAHKVLSSMSRLELSEIMCAETGLNRKYAGYTKHKIIERLLKVVNKKFKKKKKTQSPLSSNYKVAVGVDQKQRKLEAQLHKQITNANNNNNCAPPSSSSSSSSSQLGKKTSAEQSPLCRNVACKAEIGPDDVFCKRCSCSICHLRDDNKDPTLWLVCESVPPYDGQSCGLSCHLVCTLGNERMGNRTNNGSFIKLEKGFQCVSCGKINELMRCLNGQLLAASEARRVHSLSLRLKLSRQLVEGTELYRELQKTVETAAKTLENEVGPLEEAHKQMDHRIVGRLSCAADVQKLCLSALGMLDLLLPIETRPTSNCLNQKEGAACQISFEELSPTSVTVILDYEDCLLEEFLGCRLWHRKSSCKDYGRDATYVVLNPEKRFKLFGLDPCTKYFCKVSFFSDNRTLGIWEAKWVTPASTVSESCCVSILEEEEEEEEEEAKKGDNNNICGLSETTCPPPPPPPGKTSNDHEIIIKHKNNNTAFLSLNSSTKVSPTIRMVVDGCKRHVNESEYEYSVRIIRWLEEEGHIDVHFRVKFLTWFSLKATARERKVVNVFVVTLVEDPPSLAAQLLDAFSDKILEEKRHPPGFCSRLWH